MTRGTFNRRAYVREFNRNRAMLKALSTVRAEVAGIRATIAERKALLKSRSSEKRLHGSPVVAPLSETVEASVSKKAFPVVKGATFAEQDTGKRSDQTFLHAISLFRAREVGFDLPVEILGLNVASEFGHNFAQLPDFGLKLSLAGHSNSPECCDSDRITRSTGEETRSGGNAGAGDFATTQIDSENLEAGSAQ
ncbi:hypothetical protein [Asticcacaulis excentricus]|uniref:Uncharacterized protein n=1 Tax=Asticcacaulis excentricus (strain ATCC 15261 / DSM 4724 / KCTC 12464 / NCIMB 9791 / VKM B-1370 / CB 48) TaxID=573065 RepID=E8RPN8_ASTEC|nr:hypothetical protein [Asticcacaulis excentricus]ADU12015.1 hypothetical protein Astex_0317 [Asticcacaulis excentricus CB 48]